RMIQKVKCVGAKRRSAGFPQPRNRERPAYRDIDVVKTGPVKRVSARIADLARRRNSECGRIEITFAPGYGRSGPCIQDGRVHQVRTLNEDAGPAWRGREHRKGKSRPERRQLRELPVPKQVAQLPCAPTRQVQNVEEY